MSTTKKAGTKEKKVVVNYKLKVTKKLPSGMWATDKKGMNVPPYAGIEAGDTVEIKNGAYIFPERKEVATVDENAPVSRAEFEEMKAKNAELEKLIGEKGSEVKTKTEGDDK